ncbi:hypothetical protein NJBCHELONAE_18530 [Mycobacteroides chelonae]|uniref:hypothetical protein n=1 Tax=Mycobacteroides chelonae TaxID=1774 RepID=UPI0032785735|nr:hypothetical protein NJBCHELONAE_18530 [Mycobacteroides chelonae]
MHTDTGGTGAADLSDVFVGRPEEITGPMFLALLITKLPDHLNPRIDQRSAAALILR